MTTRYARIIAPIRALSCFRTAFDASVALDPGLPFAVWTASTNASDRKTCMPIELKMPALSPTMEEGTLAKWLVKEGDTVKSGDLLAEIETDKATMEFEAVDEGTISKILVAEGTDGVKVGAPIAILAGEGEDASAVSAPAPKKDETPPKAEEPKPAPPAKGGGETPAAAPQPAAAPKPAPARAEGDRVKASPLARRLAE